MCPDTHPESAVRNAWEARQAALAEFGGYALRSTDLDAILQQACVLVARGLDASISKVLEALPGGQELLLRAAVGLPPELGVAGMTRVPADVKSAAGYALKAGEPVISHIPTETRFEISAIVRRSGMQSSVNVLIPGEGKAFGALEVDSPEDRRFTADDINFLQTYANLLAAAVERQRASALLETLAHEREILLRELQHRVKNDLQVIMGFLTLEARQSEGLETRARLERARERVNALRLVHEQLFKRGQVGRVDLANYLRELCRARLRMHDVGADDGIGLEFALADVAVDHDRAISIGLIANEFLTNSLKYAFPMGSGIIRIVLEAQPPGRARLELADNGIGLNTTSGAQGDGMGMRLIGMLARQIHAETEWSDAPGARLVLSFPMERS